MSRRFNGADINRLREKGLKIIDKRPPKKDRISIPKVDCKEVQWMHWNLLYFCNERAMELIKEHRFHPQRFWRFDFAIPAVKIAIEFEGITSDQSRHTTVGGYTGDTEKYNTAAADGWKVMRYTIINYKNVLEDLRKIL